MNKILNDNLTIFYRVVAFPLCLETHGDGQQLSTISCRFFHLVNSFASRSFFCWICHDTAATHLFCGANISNFWCCRFLVLQHISLPILGFYNISVSPFWVFAHFAYFVGVFFSFGSRFAVYSETSGSHLREFTARWYSHLFFWGCNFFGQQFLCNSSSCEGGVILPPFFVNVFFFPKIFLE